MTDYRSLITLEPGKRSGKPCIRGLRITVQDVLGWLASGMETNEILHNYPYPTISLADVYAALAYYWDHRDEIERAIDEEDALVEELRRTNVSPLQEKLKQRRG